MKLTTRTRYAIRALAYLNTNPKKAITLKEVASCQGITHKYLEQIFLRLHKAGLIKTTKGPGGGYMLAKNPKKLTLKNIMDAVGETYILIDCLKNRKSCPRSRNCSTRPFWQELNQLIIRFFSHYVLADVGKKSFRIEKSKTELN